MPVAAPDTPVTVDDYDIMTDAEYFASEVYRRVAGYLMGRIQKRSQGLRFVDETHLENCIQGTVIEFQSAIAKAGTE